MRKATLVVFIEKRLRPLFKAEIYDDVEKTISDFDAQLNMPGNFIIKFGDISFRKSLFHHYEIYYK